MAGTTALAGNLSVTGVTSNADGAVATPSITNTGDLNTGIYFPAADAVGITTGGVEQFRFGSNPTTAKNLIQNGGFTVNQRGSTAVAAGSSGIGPDRFSVTSGSTAAYTLTTETDVPSGSGLLKSLKVDITTGDASIAAGEQYYVEHRVEGTNVAHLMLGTANAATVTLQFWARSRVTGVHCVSLLNSANNRSYPFEYTIAVADTWEYFTETIVLDTSGTWLTSTGIGLRVIWTLAAGSNFQGTADTWEGAEDLCTSNQVNVVSSTGTFGLAGVQLEVGSVATDFEHQDYGTTLAACQRYLYLGGTGAVGGAASTSQVILGFQFPQVMRVAPTAALTDTSINVINTAGSGLASSGSAIDYSSIKKEGALTRINGWSGGNAQVQHYPVIVYNNDPFITFSAEL